MRVGEGLLTLSHDIVTTPYIAAFFHTNQTLTPKRTVDFVKLNVTATIGQQLAIDTL